MRKDEQVLGKKFGRWTVLSFDHIDNRGCSFFLCKCDCGTIRPVRRTQLLNGTSKSCGCLHKELIGSICRKHGCAGNHKKQNNHLYYVWAQIKYRCHNSNCKEFKNYGARGITVCALWQDFVPFMDWAITNGYKEGLTIDRIDVNGNYCPENCRWITNKEQQRNKRDNINIRFGNKEQCLNAWAEEFNIDPNVVWCRIKRLGWSIEKALLTPVRINKTKGEKNG